MTTRKTLPLFLSSTLITAALFLGSSSSAFATVCVKEEHELRNPTGLCDPGWELDDVRSSPTNLPPGGTGYLELGVDNSGGAPSQGTVTVTDVLPKRLTATAPAYGLNIAALENAPTSEWNCSGSHVVTCTNNTEGEEPLQHILPGIYRERKIAIPVAVEPGPPGIEENTVTVTGGGAPAPASVSNTIELNATQPGFGFASFDGWATNGNGTPDTQAGSHPYALTLSFDLNNYLNDPNRVRNITVNAPPGLVGDPTAVPQCSRELFEHLECPNSTVIGIDTPDTTGYAGEPSGRTTNAVYNLVPPPGEPAQFGFTVLGINTFLDAGVRSGSDYGITEHADDIVEHHEISGNSIELWGVPGDPGHDGARAKLCSGQSVAQELEEGQKLCRGSGSLQPFLTLPTSCQKPGEALPRFTIEASSWQEPNTTAKAEFTLHDSGGTDVGFGGCDDLGFGPSISVAPDTSFADTPAGLTVEVKTPQEGLTSNEGLATSDIKDTTVTLPAGVVINPGQAAGLQACQANQDGLTTPEEKAKGEEDNGSADCPNASKVGEDEIHTPLLSEPLKGDVYVLQSNPPELKLLVTAVGDGVNLKLVGDASLCQSAGQVLDEKTCEAPGQLITRFSETPEFPFTTFKLAFSGGAQAALDTPTQCGTYTTASDFTPWSSPFVPDVFPSSTFTIEHGPGGGPCSSSPLPFTPSLTAGATTDIAGAFTNFSLLLQRGDGQQRISGLQFKAPEGLTGFLSKVTLCTNAQAETNTCPESSKIGHTVVESGPGPYPLVVPEPGQEPAPIYLTESYGGAPFGLSVVVPLHVGPFVLPTQRVRAKIEVNPITSQLTITTNELPQQVAGVPTDVREVDAVVERPEFMVDPTSCDAQQFSGTAYGTPPPGQGGAGASAAISSHFKVEGCGALKFEPKFSVSTSGKTSKSNGASLTAKVSYPSVPQGTDADISYVKVELPKQLPSRLTTLQKACTAKQFEANPAGCPAASKIGYATVHTPLLPVPLSGPAIFVSHGGEAFPSLTMVLQGDGVTIDLVGDTFISKAGVTSTTFKTVPDDPFSTFELTLPQGPYSALAANGNLCKPTTTRTVRKRVIVTTNGHRHTVTRRVKQTVATSLVMPNEFVGQNGAVVKQDTTIGVMGCPRTHAKAVHHARRKVHQRTRR
jgi:hypothetical protein